MTQRDFYEVLGVTRTATQEEIKISYRKLAMQYHPDRNPGDAEAEERFKEAAQAYDVLGDTDKRARYDRFGHAGMGGNAGGGQDFHNFTNINDIFSAFGDIFGGQGGGIFEQFFGGGGGRGQRRTGMGEPGADLRVRMPLTLEEIATGVDKTIKLRHWKTCTTCTGSGAKAGSTPITCSQCNGTGELRQVSRSMFGQFVNISACANCGGSGQVIKDKCTDCDGEGRIDGETTVKVTIPAGVRTGNYLSVTGKGHAGRRGGSAGDAVVVIEEQEHDVFERHEDDVVMDLTVDFPKAALGGEVEVPTLEGASSLKIDAGTQPGTILRMRNKGIPHLNSSGRGDQLVRFSVHVPTSLNSKEKATLKELAESDHFKPGTSKGAKDFFQRVKEVFS